jgi:hypothetical protein
MKKKNVLIVIGLIIVLFYINYFQVSSQTLNTLGLINVEALSSGEQSGSLCDGDGTVDCVTTYTKVKITYN